MAEFMIFLVFIPLLYWAVVFWIKALRWLWHNWRQVRDKVIRLRNAAVAAYRESEFTGDGSHR